MIENWKMEIIDNDLIEPVLIMNIKKSKIVYCNDISKKIGLIQDSMELESFLTMIELPISFEEICTKVFATKEELKLSDCKISVGKLGFMAISMRIGYLSEDELYLIGSFYFESIHDILMKNRCFQTLYEGSFSYPFRLDILTRDIQFIGPIGKQFDLSSIMHNYPEEVISSGVLVQEDLESFQGMVERMYEGKTPIHTFRCYDQEGKILWYQPRYVVNRDEHDNPVELIGEFVNIQEKIELEEKMQYDELTGCLNKAMFTSTVTDFLENSTEEHALFIVDLDNFKAINDNLGHQFGDAVLRGTGEDLIDIFRDCDYVGRIGGDEFMVLMKNVKEINSVEERASEIVKAFQNTYHGNSRIYKTSVSIGIAVYPKDGSDFSSLYDSADIALYDVKSRGKNSYEFYNPVMEEGNMSNTTPFDAADRALSQHFDQQIIVEIFALLSQAKDYRASLNKVLELLALQFNVERCYVFEPDNNMEYINNTYEWCKEGTTSEIENLQHIPREAYQPLIDLTNKEGIFYCNDLTMLKGEPTYDVMVDQGILSCLISFNIYEGQIHSMLGFDDCTNARVWSSKEIGTIMHASKIIEQFLKHIHSLNEVDKALKEKLNVLDEIYSLSYVVDLETFELVHTNYFFKQLYPHAKLGDKCYQAIQGADHPCSICPIFKMQEQQKDHYRTIIKIPKNKKEMLVNVSNIGTFDKRECVFFSCSDIGELDE
ncbi:sensor domain-containing diguanylate cyclase [Tannockella kyphosi]|uniref:sensor domain-containing diguanylate cyclase n=1 Tax=Tannockella kyphosi TaxID=2899121 RepID=UPI002013BFD4|nr:GGDEF domain-containing protein [Tannockella kyphosi]